MFSFSLATSSPAEPVPPVHCKERCKAWWGKGSGGTCSRREPFPLLSFGLLISPNPRTGLTWNAVDVGSAPGGWRSTRHWRRPPAPARLGKQAWDFPFAPQASGPRSFWAPHPQVSFHIWEQISIAYGYKTRSGKEENPYFEGNEPTMGSASCLWSAWQHPGRFSSPALRSDRRRAAALKALALSSQLGFGVTPEGPKNLHLRPKTGGWEYMGLFWRLDDLR